MRVGELRRYSSIIDAPAERHVFTQLEGWRPGVNGRAGQLAKIADWLWTLAESASLDNIQIVELKEAVAYSATISWGPGKQIGVEQMSNPHLDCQARLAQVDDQQVLLDQCLLVDVLTRLGVASPADFRRAASAIGLQPPGKDQFSKIGNGATVSKRTANRIVSCINACSGQPGFCDLGEKVELASLVKFSTPQKEHLPVNVSPGSSPPWTLAFVRNRKKLWSYSSAATACALLLSFALYQHRQDQRREIALAEIEQNLKLLDSFESRDMRLSTDRQEELLVKGTIRLEGFKRLDSNHIRVVTAYCGSYKRSWLAWGFFPIQERKYPQGQIALDYFWNPKSDSFECDQNSLEHRTIEIRGVSSGDPGHHSQALARQGIVNSVMALGTLR